MKYTIVAVFSWCHHSKLQYSFFYLLSIIFYAIVAAGKVYENKFQCFTVHFFISLNDKHQHNALHTQQ